MKKLAKAVAVLAVGMAAAGAAQAQTANTTFQVTANVQEACSVVATNLLFGAYLATADKDSSSTITVTCTYGTTYGIGITGGATGRAMTGPGGSLLYGMFNESGRTNAFSVSGALGNGAAQAYTVFGRVPAAQYVAPGDYAETVTVLVSY